ncbi:MAG TPA: hypothetical protein VJR89_18280 [Polyangiales bacterium]|nr:hypothetical protein [Polyangiales bacterium]
MRLVPWLGCMLLMAACPDESPKDDPMEPDAGEEQLDAGEDPKDDPKPDEPDEPEPEPEKPSKPQAPKPANDDPKPQQPSTPAQPSKPAMMSSGMNNPAPTKPTEMNTPSGAGASLQRFFMPTPTPRNTQFPRIEIDAKGGVHAAFPAYAGGGAYYAYCPNNCVDPKAMKVVELSTDSAPNTAMLALTPDGRPRVLLPTYLRLYYAECDKNCTESANWTTSVIVDHQSAQEVTGDAFAVDSQGRPRFIMHTYVAYLGVGQKEPHTYYAQCDEGCSDASSWRIDSIQDQIWQYSNLKFDRQDNVHLSAVIINPASSVKQLAYIRCDANCESAEGWNGLELLPAFENPAGEVKPSLSFALTSTGGVRMAGLTMPEPGSRALAYLECDEGCEQGNWSYGILSDKYELGSGVDIAVDAKDRPRLVFTLQSSIGMYYCNSGSCSQEGADWQLAKVEWASDLTPDTTILWPNCVADSWFLHDPTIALAADGSVRVGYMATDASGGWNNMPDPTMSPCVVGKDMVLARMALLPAF